MSINSKLSAADIKKIERLAEQAKCLPGMLLSTPLVSSDLLAGILIACRNFAEDIDRALGDMLSMTSINRLAPLTVRFADSRSDIPGDTRVELQGALDALKAAAPSCWTPVAPDSMPEGFRTVTAWDDSTGFPCTAFFDDEKGCWFAQSDDTRFGEGAITHWLHYVTPTGGNSGEVPA